MSLQNLTLRLDGITAGDYLTWARDPEPPALDAGLDWTTVQADPLGETIEAVLCWDGIASGSRMGGCRCRLPADAGGERGGVACAQLRPS